MDSDVAAVEHQLMTPRLCPRSAEASEPRADSGFGRWISVLWCQPSGPRRTDEKGYSVSVIPGDLREWPRQCLGRKARVCLGHPGKNGDGLGRVSEENVCG